MSKAFPALFIGGPADGRRMFLDSSRYHQIIQQEPPRPVDSFFHDFPPAVAPMHKTTRYAEVDVIGGVRIMAPPHIPAGDVMRHLVAGYRGEARC